MVQLLHIVVDDHHGVVHDDTEHHQQGGERHCIDFYFKKIQNSQRDKHRDGNGQGGDAGDAHRLHQQNHQDHGDDGDEHFPQEHIDRVRNDLSLVGHTEYRNFLWQCLFKLIQNCLHILAVLHDVVAVEHFDGKHHALFVAVGDIACHLGVFADYACDILQADDAAGGIYIDNLLCYIVFRSIRFGNVERDQSVLIFKAAADGGEILGVKGGVQRGEIHAVLNQFFLVDIDANLLVLNAVATEVGHRRDRTDPVLQVGKIAFQLTVGFFLGFDGDEQGRRTAEVVAGNDGRHAARHRVLEHRHIVPELRPELVVRLDHLRVQLHVNHHHTVGSDRIGHIFSYLFITEKELFERDGQLLLHLFGRGTGIDAHDQSLADGKGGELLLRHLDECVNAEQHEEGHNQNDDGLVLDGELNDSSYDRFFHNLLNDNFHSGTHFLFAAGDDRVAGGEACHDNQPFLGQTARHHGTLDGTAVLHHPDIMLALGRHFHGLVRQHDVAGAVGGGQLHVAHHPGHQVLRAVDDGDTHFVVVRQRVGHHAFASYPALADAVAQGGDGDAGGLPHANVRDHVFRHGEADFYLVYFQKGDGRHSRHGVHAQRNVGFAHHAGKRSI